jgi:uncharacterized membrane protein
VIGRALKVIGVSMSKTKLLLMRLFLIVVAVGCFIAAYKFLDAAMPYVGVISGNPHPSETTKIMGSRMMNGAITFFVVGLACLATLIATLFIKAPTKSE